MALLSQHDTPDENYELVAHLDNVKSLSLLLKSINFKEFGIFFASEKGLKVTVEDAKSIQASAFMQEEIFEPYTLLVEQVVFKINLTVLIECLNIFGSNSTALKMCYQGYGSPLRLILEDGGVITDCSIKTMEPEEMLDFTSASSNVLNKVILRSECLKEIFNELDPTTELVELLLSPDPPYFRLTTAGIAGETKVDIPKDSDMIESFQCSTLATSRYRYSHVKPSSKPLSVSTKVSIRTDEQGLLCFQYMVQVDRNISFIEYYCSPVADLEDEHER
ncbi:cell cycle checkpoint protein RAD1 [Anabrus simplex]|uniref:cell cycle checkpoint protein RAD1 n=1 Tax=Anabrus simplex TaxID=316456 RepID=UPI0034DD7740